VGLVTISLPEKLYFYHSTAECFFTGALALLLGYFIWIYNGGPNRFTIIGLGFVFGVGSIFLFFVSSLLMALDDIMRSCRTSILYTDEMASMYASSHQPAAPAVSAAAKAFASAGSSGAATANISGAATVNTSGAATASASVAISANASNTAAATSLGMKASNNNKNNSNNNNNNNNNFADSGIPLASNGSEMVAGITSPRTREHSNCDADADFNQSLKPSNNNNNNFVANTADTMTPTNYDTVAPTSWEPISTNQDQFWEPISTNHDDQTDFYDGDLMDDSSLPYYDLR